MRSPFAPLLLLAVLVGGCASSPAEIAESDADSTEPAPAIPVTTAPMATTVPSETVMPESTVEVVYAEAADPTIVRIPSIEVEAPIIALGLRDDGSIEVPEDADEAGWWKDGPEPGEVGPAVILGHVDSYTGPAIFFRLRDLVVGDPIHIDRIDGTTVSYMVDRIEQHDKNEFPTEDVYGATDSPVLRLVTCGGEFDRDERSYTDNLVVYATLLV